MLRFLTAGESHGPALSVVVEGLPGGLTVDREAIDADWRRRQSGYGRGGRMKIESDQVEVLSGVRHGRTLGSPVSFLIRNRDFENWRDVMSPEPRPPEAGDRRVLKYPRPGHADLAGALKYLTDDLRNVLERASARAPAGVGASDRGAGAREGRRGQARTPPPAVKAVALGAGFIAGHTSGAAFHDEILYDDTRGLHRGSNRAGGLEGGVTNGEELRAQAVVKAIPTLLIPLRSIDLKTKEPQAASVERSDTCVVPAAGVVGEAMVGWVVADALLEKLGGDSLTELLDHLDATRLRLRQPLAPPPRERPRT